MKCTKPHVAGQRGQITLLFERRIDGDTLHKSDRWDFGARIREVEVRDDGSVWLLTDGKNGKLLKLVPKA